MSWRRARVAASAGIVAATAVVARTQQVSVLEARIFRSVNRRSDRICAPVWVVMQSGALPAVFLVALVVDQRGLHRRSVSILIGGIALWLGVKVAKIPVGRGRPRCHLDDVRVRGPDQSGLGYPSGHAAIATMLALCATQPGPSRCAALGVAGGTALARLYVGAHLPLDVVGGAAIGALAADVVAAARSNASCPALSIAR